MTTININQIRYSYKSNGGFENFNFYFSPDVENDMPFIEKVPKILEEYDTLKKILISNLNFQIMPKSIEQTISNNSVSENVKLKRSISSKKPVITSNSFLSTILNMPKIETEDKFDRINLSYTISDYPNYDLRMYDSSISQESMIEVYHSIFDFYQVNLTKEALVSKNQIEFILSQKDQPISLEKLLSFN